MRTSILTLLLSVISFTLFAFNTNKAKENLLSLLQTELSPAQKVQTYRNLADLSTDKEEVKAYLWQMHQEAQKAKNSTKMIEALHDIVIAEAKVAERDSVAKYTQHVKQVASPEVLKYLLPFYRMSLFDALCYTGEKDDAIKQEIEFLNTGTSQTEDIYQRISSAYIVGIGFYANKQFEKASIHLEKAVEMTQSLPERPKFLYQRFIIWMQCFSYAQSDRNEEATQLMEQLIALEKQNYKRHYQQQRPFYRIDLDLLQDYSFMLANIRYLTIEKEEYYWKETQKIGKTLESDKSRYTYHLCANNYYSSNHTKIDLPKAIASNDSLIKYAWKLAPQNLSGLYTVSSSLYEVSKNYAKALEYLKTSHKIKDSLTTDNASRQLNELQVKYDLYALNNEKTMLEIKNKQMQVVSLSVLLIILVSISTYFYYSWKKEKRMKTELKTLHGKAQESEKMKQEFVNSICHEIRTPLNSIVGFSDIIMNEDISIEMRREFPAEIQRSANLLTGLVDCMLEVANLDVSKDQLPCKPTEINHILVHEMEKVRKKDGIEYILDASTESMLINTNEQYLAQLIEHLLDNANKFTEKGQIILGYKINEATKSITIHVTDTGCGIPPEKHESVFNRFYKFNTFVPGNGLGLYLCRLIVERISGEIRIDPQYTEGTRMIVTLPLMK